MKLFDFILKAFFIMQDVKNASRHQATLNLIASFALRLVVLTCSVAFMLLNGVTTLAEIFLQSVCYKSTGKK